MKQLQNNFTTPEQSKRLLELGVPADSADCYYSNNGIRRLRSECWMLKPNFFVEYSYNTPCWSVGRLIEIWNICVNLIPGMDIEIRPNCNLIEDLVRDFEFVKEDGMIDFSELEDYE